jgi:hypothetical protein
MTVVSGVDGAVTFQTGYDQKATSWTINVEAEDVDTTALGERWRTHLAGVYGWSGTYTAWVDAASITASAGAGATGITGTGIGGATQGHMAFGQTAAAATFTMASGTTFSGNIIITGIDGNLATAAGAGEFTFTFVGDDALTVT